MRLHLTEEWDKMKKGAEKTASYLKGDDKGALVSGLPRRRKI